MGGFGLCILIVFDVEDRRSRLVHIHLFEQWMQDVVHTRQSVARNIKLIRCVLVAAIQHGFQFCRIIFSE
jgi:hypothetical protein